MILFFQDFEDFWKLDRSDRYSNFGPTKTNELVYCKKASSKIIERKFKERYGDQYEKQDAEYTRAMSDQFYTKAFVIEESDLIVLKVILLFTPSACGVFQLVEINRFFNTTLKWASNKFFTLESNKLYSCQLNFLIKEERLPGISKKRGGKRSPLVVGGYVVFIIDVLTLHLNYTVNYMNN